MKTFSECFKEHVDDEVMSWDVEHSSIAEAFWRECAANHAPLVEACEALLKHGPITGHAIFYPRIEAALRAARESQA